MWEVARHELIIYYKFLLWIRTTFLSHNSRELFDLVPLCKKFLDFLLAFPSHHRRKRSTNDLAAVIINSNPIFKNLQSRGKREKEKGEKGDELDWVGIFFWVFCNKRENLLLTSRANVGSFHDHQLPQKALILTFSSQSLTNSHIMQLIPKLWRLTFPLLFFSLFFSLTSIVVFRNLGFLQQLVKVSRSTRAIQSSFPNLLPQRGHKCVSFGTRLNPAN